jgi:hypothetical protein
VPEADEYRCPAGERLIWRFRSVEGGKTLNTSLELKLPARRPQKPLQPR